MTGSYALPFMRDRKDWLGTLFGGWQVSTAIRISSGTPFTLTDTGPVDFDFDGVANQRPIAVDPSRNGGSEINNPNTATQELPQAHSAAGNPAIASMTSSARNTFVSDGREQVDLGLYKSFPILGDTVVFRLDVFNVFDREWWGIPTTDFASANFGRY